MAPSFLSLPLLKVFWDQILTISFSSTNFDTYFLCLQSLSASSTTYKIPTSVLIALWWPIYSNSWYVLWVLNYDCLCCLHVKLISSSENPVNMQFSFLYKVIMTLAIQATCLRSQKVEELLFNPESELQLAFNFLLGKNVKWIKSVSETHPWTLPSILLITLKLLKDRCLKHGPIQGC